MGKGLNLLARNRRRLGKHVPADAFGARWCRERTLVVIVELAWRQQSLGFSAKGSATVSPELGNWLHSLAKALLAVPSS